jgi:hypothetical protein
MILAMPESSNLRGNRQIRINLSRVAYLVDACHLLQRSFITLKPLSETAFERGKMQQSVNMQYTVG